MRISAFRQGITIVRLTPRTTRSRLDPQRADAYFLRGEANCEKELLDAALSDVNSGDPAGSPCARAFAVRAYLYCVKHQADRSIEDASRAIELAPKERVTNRSCAKCYAFAGKNDLGIADTTRFLKTNPNDAIAYAVRGTCHLTNGEYAAAIQDASQSIRIDPRCVDGYGTRAARHLPGRQDALSPT